MTSGKRSYLEYYMQFDHPLLYAAPWWLDAVCGKEKWDVVARIDQRSEPISFIPYYKTNIRGMSALVSPPFTQWLPELKGDTTESFPLVDFLNSLPDSSILDITLKSVSRDVTLSSKQYRINFKYSYIIPFHDTPEHHKKKYNEGLRRNLREAEKNYTIAVSDDLQTFLRLCHSSYEQRKIRPPQWLDQIVTDVAKALEKNQSGLLHLAMYGGIAIAGILTGWDSSTTYYLTGGRSGDERGTSAHALLLDHVIGEAVKRKHSFDFEGSMNPGIANFFQSFGAAPEPYLQIRKFSGMGKLWSIFH